MSPSQLNTVERNCNEVLELNTQTDNKKLELTGPGMVCKKQEVKSIVVVCSSQL